MLTRKTAAVAAAAALLLAACGGGSGYDTPVVTPPPVVATAVPDSAVASSPALVGYLKALKADDETADALALPAMDVSASETEEPQNL